MMVDPAGNLYYDTGSPQLGIYMVIVIPLGMACNGWHAVGVSMHQRRSAAADIVS